jgi:diguanylate cyclase (GGDEF)-like protein
VLGLFQITRAVLVTQVFPFSSIFSSNWLQLLNYSLMIAFEVLWTMGAVFMVTQRLSTELSRTARIDYLTQTLNRRAAQERLNQAATRAGRKGGIFSVILSDVDSFKEINDRLGHSTGDAALAQISEIMRKNLRLEDMHCRWGGDEFLILLEDTPDHLAAEVATRIKNALKTEKIQVQGKSIDCSLSIGVACFGGKNTTLEQTITQADTALYEAKARGGNCIVVESAQKDQPLLI